MMRSGEAASKVEAEAAGLVAKLRQDISGLSLVSGAPADAGEAQTSGAAAVGDWTKVADELRRALDEAAAMHAQGDWARAAQAVQDA